MRAIHWRNPARSLRAPEWVLAMYAFLLHFAWEMLQTPFFEGMPVMPHWSATLFCLRATLGDVAIALAAYWTVAALERNRGWFLAPGRMDVAVYLGVGIALTVILELHAVYWAQRWSYAGLMPLVPMLAIGLVPLMQWVVVPLISLFLMQRHHLGVPPAAAFDPPR